MSRAKNLRLQTVLLVGLASLAVVPKLHAAPFCPPGNNSPVCTCGKPRCDPLPPKVKYGSRTWGPTYYILSLLYDPPGTASTNAFAATNTEGTTTGISTGDSTGNSISIMATAGGATASTILGASFAVTEGKADATTYTTTATATLGSQLGSTSDGIDHSHDEFFLWMNPQVTVTQTATAGGVYSLGTADGAPMDVIDVSMAELRNPSLIPASKMGPQLIHGFTLPGLAALQPTDFAAIAAMDPLASATATPADTNRYVFLESQALEGPDSGSGQVKNMFGESDSTQTAKTKTETATDVTSISVGEKVGLPEVFSLSLTFTHTLTWTYSTSAGKSSGTGKQASITLGTSKTGCREWVDIYSDTMFHTMAFVTAHPTCAPLGVRNFATVALTGVLLDTLGKPQPHQTVSLTLPNGTIRHIVTDSKGRYELYGAPTGTVQINAHGIAAQAQVVTGKTVVAPVLTLPASILNPTTPVLVPPVLKQTDPVLKPTLPFRKTEPFLKVN